MAKVVSPILDDSELASRHFVSPCTRFGGQETGPVPVMERLFSPVPDGSGLANRNHGVPFVSSQIEASEQNHLPPSPMSESVWARSPLPPANLY